MAASPRPKLSPTKLQRAYRADLTAAWDYFRRRRPDQTPYAFVLYGVESPIEFTAQVLTEQGLDRVAAKYIANGHFDAMPEARRALRYSVADSPLFDELLDRLPTVEALLKPHADMLEETSGYAVLAKAAIAALKEMDAEGLFGTGAERERLLLGIITFDVEQDGTTPSIRRLNPATVVQRFEAETKVEGVYASCDAVAVAPGGNSLFAAEIRENPDNRDGPNHVNNCEIVAFDLADRRPARRWTFTFPAFGDSCRALVCAADGSSVLALRAKYNGPSGSTLLMRFGRDSNAPTGERVVEGEPASFAQSPGGDRIAVAMHRKTLHLFDRELRPLAVHPLKDKPYGLCFLRSGQLLVATDRALLRLDPVTGAEAGSVPVRSFRLHADDSETLLAVSRWFAITGPERDKPTEFPAHLLSLPTLSPVRTFLIPGHQAVTATLSPDGRLLVVEAHEVGTPRKFLVAFDTATGLEVARKKSSFVRDLAFLPDGRTLVIPTSGYTTGEPIEFWTIPVV